MKTTISLIRKEIRELESDLTYLIIEQMCSRSAVKVKERIEIEERISTLKHCYPN